MLIDRARIVRSLRIAFTVFFGIACVLLVVLWVRSFHKKDDLRGLVGDTVLNIQSLRGELGIGNWGWRFSRFPWRLSNENVDDSMERLWRPVKDRRPLSLVGVRWQHFAPEMTMVVVRYWALVLLAATLAVAPWMHSLRWRFSLRTLLVVITTVAVVLGLIVAAKR